MDYSVRWLIENELIILTQYNDLTIKQIEEMVKSISVLMDASPKPKVPIIVNGSHMSATSHNLIQAVKAFKNNRSEKWGFTVVVGTNGIVQFISQGIMQLARVEMRFAKDMPDAIEILRRVDPNMPDIDISVIIS